MHSSSHLLQLEAALVGTGIAAATAGYLLSIAVLEFFGILGGCIAFGILIARAFGE